VDYGAVLPELDETNNTYGVQYVWTPMLILMNTPVYRTQPAPATAGWEHLPEGSEKWYNADGVRTQAFDPTIAASLFGCVAILAEDTVDVDLQLYSPSLGFTDGFAEPLISSTWPPGQTDFVLMKLEWSPRRQFDAGVVSNDIGQEPVMVVITESQYSGVDTVGDLDGNWMGSDKLVRLYNIEYEIPGRTYRVDLIPVYKNVDLGLSVYGPGVSYYSKGDVYDDGAGGSTLSYLAPPDANESVTFTVNDLGWYAIAVWRVGAADRSDSTLYNLSFTEVQAVGVENNGPIARTHLVGAYPNPFNPMTTVAFELDSTLNVKLEIFDVRGRLVHVLADEPFSAGRHERVWRGLDANNQTVASGVYMIRMTAGDTVDLKRVSLIK